MFSGFVSESGPANVRVDVLGVAVVPVPGRRSLNLVVGARSADLATESGLDDSGLGAGSPELGIRGLPDLLDLGSVVAETGSLDRGITSPETNRGALVSESRLEVLDVRSAESIAEFGAEGAERGSAGAISEFGSVDTKAGLGSPHAELRLGSTESELDTGAAVLEGAVVGNMGLLASSGLAGGVVTRVMAAMVDRSFRVGVVSITVNSMALAVGVRSLLPSGGDHGEGSQSGDSEHFVLV